MKRIAKKMQKEREQFTAQVNAMLESNGAVTGSKRVGALATLYDFELNTPHGLIFFSVDSPSIAGVGQVFGRFDNLEMGKMFGANPYSGKWNHHYFEPWTCAQAVQDFAWQLLRVLTAAIPMSEMSAVS